MENNSPQRSGSGQSLNWIISEAAFFAFLYYAQYLLGIQGNILISSLVLWGLINISIVFCPVLRKYGK